MSRCLVIEMMMMMMMMMMKKKKKKPEERIASWGSRIAMEVEREGVVEDKKGK